MSWQVQSLKSSKQKGWLLCCVLHMQHQAVWTPFLDKQLNYDSGLCWQAYKEMLVHCWKWVWVHEYLVRTLSLTFCLSDVFSLFFTQQISGLSTWVAELLTPLGSLPPLATVTITCLIVTSITEVASNAATTTIFLPILAPLVCAISIYVEYYFYITFLGCSHHKWSLLGWSNWSQPSVHADSHGTMCVLFIPASGF